MTAAGSPTAATLLPLLLLPLLLLLRCHYVLFQVNFIATLKRFASEKMAVRSMAVSTETFDSKYALSPGLL